MLCSVLRCAGNGVAQLGMYMYHGGTDPMGQLSTMQESQITK